jgi:hypothetical protein
LDEWRNTGKGKDAKRRVSKKSRKISALFNDQKHRNHMMNSLNKNTLDDGAAPLGNGEMTLFKDMERGDKEHDQHMQDLKGGG